jgi:hypothetical protein
MADVMRVVRVLIEIYVADSITPEDEAHYAERVFEGIRREWEAVGFSNENNPVETLDVTCGDTTYSIEGGLL